MGTITVGWLLILFIIVGIVTYVADKKGKVAPLWFIYALFLTPIAFIHVLLTSPNAQELEQRAIESGKSKKCPKCAEVVRREASVCRFCGHDFTGNPNMPPS